MKRAIFLLIVCLQSAVAQKPTGTIENFSIHQAKDGDEDVSSDFPIVHTGSTAADARINNFLQTRFFGRPYDDKSKAAIHQNFDPRGDKVFSYTTQIADRFVGIVIKKYHVNNAMSLNGYDESFPFYFDLRSGESFSPLALFSERGTLLFLGKAFLGFRESYNQTMDKYLEGFSKLKVTAQKQQCECDCEGMLQDAFRNGAVSYNFSKDGILLSMDGCNWQNPGPHDNYSVNISLNDLRSWLSDFGKYMIDGGVEVNFQTLPLMLFQGKLGDNIHTTFVLHRQGNDELTGYEIYNSIGSTIDLHGTLNGNQFTFDEMSPEKKSVATFKATLVGTSLTGTWTKSDKTRSLNFTAIKY